MRRACFVRTFSIRTPRASLNACLLGRVGLVWRVRTANMVVKLARLNRRRPSEDAPRIVERHSAPPGVCKLCGKKRARCASYAPRHVRVRSGVHLGLRMRGTGLTWASFADAAARAGGQGACASCAGRDGRSRRRGVRWPVSLGHFGETSAGTGRGAAVSRG